MIEISQIKSDSENTSILRKFGIAVGGIIAVVFGVFIPISFGHGFLLETFIVGILLLLLGCFVPSTLKWAYIGWMVAASAIGVVNTKILLSLVYFLVIFPMGLIWRLNRIDKLALKRSVNEESFFYRVKSGSENIDMTVPF